MLGTRAVCLLLPLLRLATASTPTFRFGLALASPGANDHAWAYQLNIGRLKVGQWLEREFPEMRTRSDVVVVAKGSTAEEVKAELAVWGEQRLDLVILGGDPFVMPGLALAREYPDTHWLAPRLPSHIVAPPNFKVYAPRMYQSRYATGILAGVALSSDAACVGYVAAAWNSAVVRQLNAFALGVQSVRPNATVFCAWGNSFGDTEELKLGLDWVLSKGCEIVSGHSSNIGALHVAIERGAKVIGSASPLRESLGDAVLTSAYYNWEPIFEEVTLSVIDGTFDALPPRNWVSYNLSAPGIEDVSHALPAQMRDRFHERVGELRRSLVNGTYDNIFCGPLYSNSGRLIAAAGECLSDAEVFSMQSVARGIREQNISVPRRVCNLGMRWSRDADGHVLCTPCPDGFHCSGVCEVCVPCSGAPGACAGGGSSSAVLFMIVAVGAACAVLFCTLVVIARMLWRGRLGGNVSPPTGDRVAIAVTDIEDSTALWQADPFAMRCLMKTHNETVRKCIKESDGFEVNTLGDSFVVAYPAPSAAVQFAVALQRELHAAEWELGNLTQHTAVQDVLGPDGTVVIRGLRVRVGVHCGPVVVWQNTHATGTEYLGPTSHIATSLARIAQGGQILASTDCICDGAGAGAVARPAGSMQHRRGPVQIVCVSPAELGFRDRYSAVPTPSSVHPTSTIQSTTRQSTTEEERRVEVLPWCPDTTATSQQSQSPPTQAAARQPCFQAASPQSASQMTQIMASPADVP